MHLVHAALVMALLWVPLESLIIGIWYDDVEDYDTAAELARSRLKSGVPLAIILLGVFADMAFLEATLLAAATFESYQMYQGEDCLTYRIMEKLSQL